MTTSFRYEGVAASGLKTSGFIEAESLPLALELLQQRGVRPYHAELATMLVAKSERNSILTRSTLSLSWRAKIVRQLATLLAAGITLDRAIKILTAQATTKNEQEILHVLLKNISNGLSFSGALLTLPHAFRSDEIGLIRAGEQTGTLSVVLEELANLLERRVQLRSKLFSALVYPAFILTLAPVSLFVIATVLVPSIAPLFENSGAVMPLALRSMIWAGEEFQARGVVWLLVSALLVYLIRRATRLPAVPSVINKLPVIKVVRKRKEAAHITRTLGSLLRSGAPLQTALGAVADSSQNSAASTLLQAVKDAVSRGVKLAVALEVLPSLDKLALQMIAIGEETNKLESMLIFVADSEEKALADYLDRLMTLLTPVLTVLMGLFVGGIVMSIMSAILSVNDLVLR